MAKKTLVSKNSAVFLLVIVFSMIGTITYAQTTNSSRYFPETGHWVSGDFLIKYDSTANGQEIYGNPITSAFTDMDSNRLVQYFEKVRFELHPEAVSDLRVEITPLGSFLYTSGEGEVVTIPENSSSCQFYPESGFSVCHAFLEYFQENGGVSQFGYPISGVEIHGGWTTQYFQRARFELHPELPVGERVVLTNLGTRYFYSHGENPIYLQPQLVVVDDTILKQPATALRVHAFVSRPILPQYETEQKLYVVVYDQNFKPVEGVFVSFTILQTGQDDEDISGRMQNTNQDGVSVGIMDLPLLAPGTIEVKIYAVLNTIGQQTITSFQVW
jgi:hypothetical protein